MALLRRIVTSSARIQFRLLLSSARHTYASPQGGGFTTGMLHHRDAFSLRRLLTSSFTPSSSAGRSPPPPPTDPPQGSSAGRGEGGKPQDPVRFLKDLLRLKLLYSVLGLVFTVVVINEGYCVYLACRGDAPSMSHGEDQLWIPSTSINTKALLDDVPKGSFCMVAGCPGIGKTTQLCDAARDRGAIYLDGAAQQSFNAIQATINRRYRSLRLSFMSWMRPESGLEIVSDLSFWVKLFRQKHLVFIVDHVDKLAQADVLQLVSWAKTQADRKRVKVILVGSEQSTRLISNSDTRTRGNLVLCYPPSAQETREALRKFMSTHPDKYNLDVEKCLYLRGTCPTEYQLDKLLDTEEYIMNQFTEKHDRFKCAGRDFPDKDFWFTLLVAGSNGVSLVETENVALQETQYYVPDRDKVLSEPCILYYKRKVYFISGCSREMHAALLLQDYEGQVRSSSAEVERLSAEGFYKGQVRSSFAEVERLSAEGFYKRLWSMKLAREKEKLVKAKERIAKIQECMANKSYEAYGPL